MHQGKASVLHKESRTGSRASHRATHLSAHTYDKGKAVRRRRVRKNGRVEKRTKEEKEGITKKIWYAHVNKRFLPGSVWAPCYS